MADATLPVGAATTMVTWLTGGQADETDERGQFSHLPRDSSVTGT
jgi:hypothetical protein